MVSWRIAVVGGGIAGLSAAHHFSQVSGVRVTVLEGADRLGGKLRTQVFDGAAVEAGAEAFLTRTDGTESAAHRLATDLGLPLAHPGPAPAALALDGGLRPLPGGTLLGVPASAAAVAAVATLADADRDDGRPVLAPGVDVAVGALVRARLGDQVVDRLVDPLLGGVYAGRADDLSLAVTVPALAEALTREHTLMGAAGAVLAARQAASPGPVFATVVGGMSRLVAALAEQVGAAGHEIRCGTTVRELRPGPAGWRLTAGSTSDAEIIEADAVVLAIPARAAARLLATVIDDAALGPWATLNYASLALVTLALPEPDLPALSGLLVPAGRGFAVKAATFFTRKWSHLTPAPGTDLVRVSMGRHGDTGVLRRTDEDLIALAHKELGDLIGVPVPVPVAAAVNRWGGALPQYPPGHLDHVAALRRALPPTVAVAGAAVDGVGIPAGVRSGQTAAGKILAHLAESTA